MPTKRRDFLKKVTAATAMAATAPILSYADTGSSANEQTKAAFIYIASGNDPKVHKAVINSPVIHLTVVGVVDYGQAEKIAKELVKDGITAIELCAGFGNEGTARICKAVAGKAIVGVVRFDIHPAFGYKSGDALFS